MPGRPVSEIIERMAAIALPITPAAEEEAQPARDIGTHALPFTADAQTIFLGGLLALASLTVAYFAADVILPLILALLLKLLLQPAMRLLQKAYVPKLLAAFLVIWAVFSGIVGIGLAVAEPAAHWAAKLPGDIPLLQERLRLISQPIATVEAFLHQMENIGQQDGATASTAASSNGLSDMLFRGTQHFASGLFETILILFFLLVSGDVFLRRLVEILPRFKDKRQVVALSQQIEKNISLYLLTITMMNIAVGVATGLATWACGLDNAMFWGVFAFLLNYMPILGACVGIVLLLVAGLVQFDSLWHAILPALLFLVIHIIEGETITPMLLARRFTLNPVLVIVSLIFWFWMWGVVGAFLAVPMLAIAKLIFDGIARLQPLGHFLEGEAP